MLPLLDPVSRTQWAVANEADHLEDLYGRAALEWVRQEISRAPKPSRARLYRVHDELRRRHGSGVRHH